MLLVLSHSHKHTHVFADVENDLLRSHLPGVTYLRLDGSVPANLRHGIVTTFNNDPSIDLLLLTTRYPPPLPLLICIHYTYRKNNSIAKKNRKVQKEWIRIEVRFF